MPKLKLGAPRHSRYSRGKQIKRGSGWQIGQVAKAKIAADAKAQVGRAAAREARERAAEQRYGSSEPSTTASARAPARELNNSSKATNARKRKRQQRERDGTDASVVDDDERAAKRRERRAAAAELPQDIGASAPTRHAAFDRDGRSANAVRQSAEYNTRVAGKQIKKLCSKGELAKAAAVLGGLLRDPEIRPLLAAAGAILSEDASMDRQMLDNVADLIAAMGTGRGNRSYQARGVDTVLAAVVDGTSPQKLKASAGKGRKAPKQATASACRTAAAQPSVRGISKRLRLAPKTGSRKLSVARARRRALNEHEEGAYLIDMSRRVHRAGRCRITPEKLGKIVEWISSNEYVRTCPEKKQTLLIRGADGKKNVRVPKLLCEINLTKLFLQAEEELGKEWLGMRENTFRKILPANLRRLTKRFESCGNPARLRATRLHQALVAFRRMHKARLAGTRAAAAYTPPDHKDIYAALNDRLPPECQRTVGRLRPACCWMRRGCKCGGIRKRYWSPPEEKAKGRGAPTITFSDFETHVRGLTRKGKPRKVSELVKLTLPIGEFMEDYYLPMLEHTDYHVNNHSMIYYCEKVCHNSLRPGDGDDERDFGEKLADAFEDAQQSDHWTSRTVTEEASITRTYPASVCEDFARAQGAFADGSDAAPTQPPRDAHELFISGYEKQDSTIVFENMDAQVARLLKAKRLRRTRTGRPPTLHQYVDGCSGQYWSGKVAYLSAKIAKQRRVTIDRKRNAPGEGKRKVDGVHAVFKREARDRMLMRQVAGAVKREAIAAESRRDGASTCLAEEVHRVMSRDCTSGAPVSKNAKRQREGAMESREYHLYREEGITQRKLGSFATVNVPTTPEERCGNLPYCGWRAHFNLRLDPALPLNEASGEESGDAMLRRWGCYCPACHNQLQMPKLEDRYKPNPNCVLAPVVGTLNDWKRITFCRKPAGRAGAGGDADGDGDDDRLSDDDSGDDASDAGSDASNVMLLNAAEQLGSIVLPGDSLLWDAGGDEKAAGEGDERYYSGAALSAMYALEEDEDSDWGMLPAGAMIVEASYNNLVFAPGHAQARWYTPSNPPIKVKVPVEHLLHVGFAMAAAAAPERPNARQKDALNKGAIVLSEDDHLQAMDAFAYN